MSTSTSPSSAVELDGGGPRPGPAPGQFPLALHARALEAVQVLIGTTNLDGFEIAVRLAAYYGITDDPAYATFYQQVRAHVDQLVTAHLASPPAPGEPLSSWHSKFRPSGDL